MHNSFEHIEAIIWKYLDGEANAEEQGAVERWKSIRENQEAWKEYIDLHAKFLQAETAHQPADVDIDIAWQKVSSKINEGETKIIRLNIEGAFGKWMKYAAAIIVAFGIGWWMVNTTTEQDVVQMASVSYLPADSVREVSLPDGSVVTMKKGAALSFAVEDGAIRKVIFEGSGYFDVYRDTTMPFIIESGDAVVRVLGTSFYVETNETGETAVSVNTGKVRLSHKNPETKSDYVELGKGEKGKVRNRKKPLKETLQTMNFLSWRNHKLRFKNTRLLHVFEDLEEYYQVHFNVENELLLDCRLSGKFYRQSLDELLDMLSMTFEFQIMREGDQITVQGEGCQ